MKYDPYWEKLGFRKKGIIDRIGSRKNGYWKINYS
jgi:hypothetical protein